MLSKIKKNLFLPEVKVTVIIGIIIIILFSIYLKFIGLSATTSQNIFNDGVRAYDKGDLGVAKELFLEADKLWAHSEIEEYIKYIDDSQSL